MSDIVKWGLLIAGIVALIFMILSLPFVSYLDVNEVTIYLSSFVHTLYTPLISARAVINNFLPTYGRTLLSGVLCYTVTKWILTIGIKITTWVYHFIFK